MNKLKKFEKELFKIASRRDYWLRSLGIVNGDHIWFASRIHPGKVNVLVVAGFHGEEIAGPFSILRFMEEFQMNSDIRICFIPIVNLTGFNKNKRYNIWNEVSNCGFIHREKLRDRLSREGQTLVNNSDLILECARDGMLSLHEDSDTDKSYLYTFGDSEEPGEFSFLMRDELSKFFEMLPDNEEVNDPGRPHVFAKDGIIYNFHDGSFEDWLWHSGVKKVVTSETPGKKKFDLRVEAGVSVIKKFIELCQK